MRKSFNWKLWLGLLISGLFACLALRQVDLFRVWKVIQSADPPLLLLVALTLLFQYVIRAWRWGILLRPLKKTGFLHRTHSLFIGFAANCVLPARLGELIRANTLGRSESLSASSVFGTIVVERLFDGFTLLAFLVIGLLGTSFPAQWRSLSASLRATGLSLFILYLLLVLFFVGFKVKTKLFLNLLDRILFLVPSSFRTRITDILWKFSLGLALVKDPFPLFLAAFCSVLLWLVALLQIQLIAYAIDLPLPLIAPFLIMAMASLGVMIPSAPGFIGTFHLSVQYGFLFYGVGREEALSAAILWHASFFFPAIILGFLSFVIVQLSLPRLGR